MLSFSQTRNHSNISIRNIDPYVTTLIQKENLRQTNTLNLIASENIASPASLSALSSSFSNKYSEGYPHSRFYGGNENVDQLEILTQKRALSLFNLDPNQWNANVQPLSGSAANLAVYTALLHPNDSFMGLSLSDGGHLTHGHFTSKRKVSASSIFWHSIPYHTNHSTGLIDYDLLEKSAIKNHPRLIICGASSYPRNIDFHRMSIIAKKSNSILFADISHVAGLIAAKLVPSAFPYADIVSTTTHKTLRGPRGAIIFSKAKFSKKINQAVFPGIQGGPHVNQIAGIAVALKEAQSPDFRTYQAKVLRNAKVLAENLNRAHIPLITGGTDTHLILIDLRPLKIDGTRVQMTLEAGGIVVNKNSVPGGKLNAGLRIGTPTVTTRGMGEKEMKLISEFLIRGINISRSIQRQLGDKKKISNFKKALNQNSDIKKLRKEVESLCLIPEFRPHFNLDWK